MKRFVRGKKFAPRKTSEQLIEETSSAFNSVGGDNFIQSRVLHDLQLWVADASDIHIFARLQPAPKVRDSQAWIYAYTIVLAFLNDYGMTETISTAVNENGGEDFVTDANALNEKPAVKFITDLLRRRRLRFDQRVSAFYSWLAAMDANRVKQELSVISASGDFISSDSIAGAPPEPDSIDEDFVETDDD
jgi:hypothetical protein